MGQGRADYILMIVPNFGGMLTFDQEAIYAFTTAYIQYATLQVLQ